jgi:hypothetical protein
VEREKNKGVIVAVFVSQGLAVETGYGKEWSVKVSGATSRDPLKKLLCQLFINRN